MPWNHIVGGPFQLPPPPVHEPTPNLRAQLLPFQDYSPQQIQEQLQRLHIQQQHEPQSLQPTVVANQADYDFAASQITNSTADTGGAISVTSSGSSSSITSSRKNSLIEQILLSPSPPAAPVPSPQTHGASSASNSVFGHSPPSEHLHQQVGRRHSYQDSATQIVNKRIQRYACGNVVHHRCCYERDHFPNSCSHSKETSDQAWKYSLDFTFA